MAEPITIDIILTAKNRTQAGVKETARGLDTLTQSAKKAKKGLDDTDKSSRQVQRTLREMAREKVMILLEAKDRLSPVLGQAKSSLKGLAGKAWTVTLKTGGLCHPANPGDFKPSDIGSGNGFRRGRSFRRFGNADGHFRRL